MKRGSGPLSGVFLVLLALCTACSRGAEPPDLSKLGPSSAATSTVLPVGSPNCAAGGIGIYTGSDGNGNGILEASEYLKGVPVCDQLTEDGKPAGNGSLVMVVSEPTGTSHCLAGGLKVLSGPDTNRNNLLDTDEIAFTEYLCNGTPGTGSAAGITVAAGPPAVPSTPDKKKAKRTVPARKPQAGADKSGKSADKSAQLPAKPDVSASSAVTEKTAEKKASQGKTGSAKPAPPPQGWTAVTVNNPRLASVAYKIEGRYITVRFTNLSSTSAVRFKYTVRWKVNQNGNWVPDSTMEGISFRLKPQDSLEREVRTPSTDFRDTAVDVDVIETS
jgi:hypothetical protein